MRTARESSHAHETANLSQAIGFALALLAYCALSLPAAAQEPEGGQELPVVEDATDQTQPATGDPAPAEGEGEGTVEPDPIEEDVPPVDDRTDERKAEDKIRRESRARRKLLLKRFEQVNAYYWQALKAFRSKRYSIAIKWCDKALMIDPEDLSVQKLKYISERSRQSHTLALEDERDKFRIEENLADIERDNRFPDPQPPLPRPTILLREHTPKSEAMRKMEERLNQRVSMNFIDADLDYVLQTLFKISGVDILAEQSIVEEKTLTLHVENVPLKEILEFIKRNYEGIEYTVTESAVWLTSPEQPPLLPKLYPLSRGLVSSSTFSSGVRSSTRPGVTGNNSNNNNNNNLGNLSNLRNLAGMDASSLARALGGGMTGNTNNRSNNNTGSSNRGTGGAGSESHLEAVLQWVETWDTEWPIGSQWWLDRQTNTLMVLTTPQMHDRIEEVLDVMDTVPTQVLLKTKFIEVLSDDLNEFGVSDLAWQEWTDPTRVMQPVVSNPGLVGAEGSSLATQGFGSVGDTGFKLNFAKYLSNSSEVLAKLSALDKKQRTRVLSAPHIIAMNNTPAMIDISKSFSYASQYRSTNGTIVNDNNSISVPNAMVPSQFEDISVGFFVEFVPSVGRDKKNIVLDLHARVDEVVGNIEDFQNIPIIVPGSTDPTDPDAQVNLGGSSTQAIQRPIVDGREFQTRLVIQDGGTIVIGGLLKNFQETVRRQVPVLGQIPILGWLFRYSKETTKQSNLIIVVEAHIVTPSGQYYAAPSNDELGTTEIQSFSSKPVKREWIPDVAPEVRNALFPDEIE